MKITLNDDEVREALAEAIGKKTNYLFDTEECWFSVTAAGSEIMDIEEVLFTAEITTKN